MLTTASRQWSRRRGEDKGNIGPNNVTTNTPAPAPPCPLLTVPPHPAPPLCTAPPHPALCLLPHPTLPFAYCPAPPHPLLTAPPHPLHPSRELYSRLWSELYSLLQTHLKAREGAVQVCRDITRLVGMRAKVDHLADSLLKRVKDAWGNLTEDMVRV